MSYQPNFAELDIRNQVKRIADLLESLVEYIKTPCPAQEQLHQLISKLLEKENQKPC